MREGRRRNKGGGEREKGKEGEKKEEEETEEETERGQGERGREKRERRGRKGRKEVGREGGREVGRESHKTITIQSHNRSYLCALDHGVLRKPSSRMHRDTPCLLSCKKSSGQWQCRHLQGWGLCWRQVWQGSLRGGGTRAIRAWAFRTAVGAEANMRLTGRKLTSVSPLKSFPTPFPPCCFIRLQQQSVGSSKRIRWPPSFFQNQFHSSVSEAQFAGSCLLWYSSGMGFSCRATAMFCRHLIK